MYDMQTSSPFIIGFMQRTTILGPYLYSSRKESQEKSSEQCICRLQYKYHAIKYHE
jgi:hypothetical protein